MHNYVMGDDQDIERNLYIYKASLFTYGSNGVIMPLPCGDLSLAVAAHEIGHSIDVNNKANLQQGERNADAIGLRIMRNFFQRLDLPRERIERVNTWYRYCLSTYQNSYEQGLIGVSGDFVTLTDDEKNRFRNIRDQIPLTSQ